MAMKTTCRKKTHNKRYNKAGSKRLYSGFALLMAMLIAVSGCSLFIDDSADTGQVCVPKEKAEKLKLISEGNDTAPSDEGIFCAKEYTNARLSISEAIAIAKSSECGKYGIKEPYACNNITGTWWLSLDAKKEGCNPACVVNVETKAAEINWRCTGLKEQKEATENESTAKNTENNTTSNTEENTAEAKEEQKPEEKSGKDTISNIPVREYTEGDFIVIKPKATDADNDTVTFSFSEPLNSKGEWQTKEGDAGSYIVTITASDGKTEVSKKLKIVVHKKNSAPVIDINSMATVKAGEQISLNPIVTDADNDSITISYSGWMDSSVKLTSANDTGTHEVTITASDGKTETSKTITIVVKENHAPVIEDIKPVTVTEGDLVALNVNAYDADNDSITISYGEPIGSNGEWQTKKGDAGSYVVTITASDGIAETTATATINVLPLNHVPVIEIEDLKVIIQSGETGTIKLEPKVTDADNDNIELSYSGWMNSSTKTITEKDEGTHEVTITASDGKTETSKTITITVEVNHAPEFTF